MAFFLLIVEEVAATCVGLDPRLRLAGTRGFYAALGCIISKGVIENT